MTWDPGLHPRHPAGAPGGKGGEFAPKVGMSESVMSRVAEPDGGFSLQPVTGEEPTDGFMVSIMPEASFSKDIRDLRFMDLVSYYAEHRSELSKRDNFLGAWHDPETHKVYIDISRHVRTSDEARSLALASDQIAFYDVKAGKSVDVNRAATSGGAAGP